MSKTHKTDPYDLTFNNLYPKDGSSAGTTAYEVNFTCIFPIGTIHSLTPGKQTWSSNPPTLTWEWTVNNNNPTSGNIYQATSNDEPTVGTPVNVIIEILNESGNKVEQVSMETGEVDPLEDIK